MKHTHPEITDPALRAIFARELLVLRQSMKRAEEDLRSDWVCGIRLGFETAFRRVNYYVHNVTTLSEAVTLFNAKDNRPSAAD